jgi:hypothetical protein
MDQMDFNGRFANMQLTGGFFVAGSVCNQAKDFPFTFAEGFARWYGELAHKSCGQLWGQGRLALRDRLNGREELLSWRIFEHSRLPRLQSHAEYPPASHRPSGPGPQVLLELSHLRDYRGPTHPWHAQVQQNDIWMAMRGQGQDFCPTGSFANDLKFGLARQHPLQARTNHGMIISLAQFSI